MFSGAVLIAPTGAGKTTRVPPALLDAEFSGALAQAVAGGAQVTQISAIGPYDWATNTIVSELAGACVE